MLVGKKRLFSRPTRMTCTAALTEDCDFVDFVSFVIFDLWVAALKLVD